MYYPLICNFILLLFVTQNQAQTYILDTIQDTYPFINWKANRLQMAEKSKAFQNVFEKLEAIRKGESRKLHIFHIGGSHIQADIYSNRLRSYLQRIGPKARGQRGLIFPYTLAKTNNPSNYKIRYTGKWEGYRCATPDSVAWGLAGITAIFRDSISRIQVQANGRNYAKHKHQFNRIRIFYNTWEQDYAIGFEGGNKATFVKKDLYAHFKEFTFDKAMDAVEFRIQQLRKSKDAKFLLMGIELMHDNFGIEYTSIGVNGAAFSHYKRCAFFDRQLQLYNPDLFIISIGTNDAYPPDFNPDIYEANYAQFIRKIQQINPNCAILLTVPNDSYYQKEYANPRTAACQKVIYKLAKKYRMAVWDFYEIMGGLDASSDWHAHRLMPNDRIHFTRYGYKIKADLLLQALVNSWENAVHKKRNSILSQLID